MVLKTKWHPIAGLSIIVVVLCCVLTSCNQPRSEYVVTLPRGFNGLFVIVDGPSVNLNPMIYHEIAFVQIPDQLVARWDFHLVCQSYDFHGNTVPMQCTLIGGTAKAIKPFESMISITVGCAGNGPPQGICARWIDANRYVKIKSAYSDEGGFGSVWHDDNFINGLRKYVLKLGGDVNSHNE